MATDPSGNFCVIMNKRFTEEATVEEAVSQTPGPVAAIAA